MLGWSIRARACRSASKRAMTCRESMPALMNLSGDQALDRRGLLGHPDGAHAALADRLDELVRADHRAGALRGRLVILGRVGARRDILEEAARGVVACKSDSISPRSFGVGAAGLVQVRGPALGG